MDFRTVIDIKPDSELQLSHTDGIVMLGSCFTDNVGALLDRDGFRVCHNPMGPLYNPLSIMRALQLALSADDDLLNSNFVEDSCGKFHCLHFASRYVADSIEELEKKLVDELAALRASIYEASTLIFTYGTAYVYKRHDTAGVVGNCHKFPTSFFDRELMDVEAVEDASSSILSMLPSNIENVIFTVSPIRHVADGLHANQLSKATLQLGVDHAISNKKTHGAKNLRYFPAYEIVMDDLRDYRFYDSDMKHPSDVAIDYIYENFSTAFFSVKTKEQAIAHRKEWKRAAHRPIIE